MNLKEQIINAQDTALTPVEVPEWGVTVFIKRLTVGERRPLLDALTDPENMKGKIMGVYAIMYCVFDQDGKPVFGPEDYDFIAARSAESVLRVGYLAAKLNGLVSDDTVAEAKKD